VMCWAIFCIKSDINKEELTGWGTISWQMKWHTGISKQLMPYSPWNLPATWTNEFNYIWRHVHWPSQLTIFPSQATLFRKPNAWSRRMIWSKIDTTGTQQASPKQMSTALVLESWTQLDTSSDEDDVPTKPTWAADKWNSGGKQRRIGPQDHNVTWKVNEDAISIFINWLAKANLKMWATSCALNITAKAHPWQTAKILCNSWQDVSGVGM
jgi:hypothetical protein